MKKKILLATIGLTIGTVTISALPINGKTVSGKSDSGKSVSGKSGNGKFADTIELSQCIPLADVAEYYVDNDGYYHVVLKDIGNQLDDPENISYAELFAAD